MLQNFENGRTQKIGDVIGFEEFKMFFQKRSPQSFSSAKPVEKGYNGDSRYISVSYFVCFSSLSADSETFSVTYK